VTGVSSIDALVDWLIDGAPGAADAAAVVTRIGETLNAGPTHVDRIAAFVTTLHPTVAGRAFRWSLETGTVVSEAPHRMFETETFKNSPVNQVFATKKELRLRLGPTTDRTYAVIDSLVSEGFTDYLIVPLIFTTGQAHGITFSTKVPGGFTDAALDDLRRIARPLARMAEILALRRTASTLLSTYVGRNSGDRILAGRIQKGDFETVRAVIWFSDLRGFTEMSSRASPREVIDTLNQIFECQVPAIEKRGGEVLKFMGDGLLAIFPFTDAVDPAKTADLALEAADEALAAVAELAPLRIGLALHVGELAYGNIGGSNRLDFTAIGATVNVAARLEGLTSKLGRPLIMSEDFARMTTRATDDLGAFELKGVPTPVRGFAPRA
jgi:adenylate cyclase